MDAAVTKGALGLQVGGSGRLSGCRVICVLNGTELFGHEKGNIEVFKALRSEGAAVHVGVNAAEHGGSVGARVRSLGFSTFELPLGCQWSKAFFRSEPLLLFKSCKQVVQSSFAFRRAARRVKPTHIHLGNALAYSYLAPALQLMSTPMVFRVGDEPPVSSKPNLMIWKACARRASRIVANSEFVRGKIASALPNGAKKIHVIYNVAASAATPCKRVEKNGVSRVLYVGQIAEHKGIEHVVAAALSLMGQNRNVAFDIVGGSVYTAHYEAYVRGLVARAGAQERIRFHGYAEDVGRFYEQADALVVPSIFEEPAANVVCEAKSAGVPAVVYPSGGLPELVRHEIDGFVCESKSVDALVKGVRWALDDYNRGSASQAAVEDYARRFGSDRFAEQWAEVYREAMA